MNGYVGAFSSRLLYPAEELIKMRRQQFAEMVGIRVGNFAAFAGCAERIYTITFDIARITFVAYVRRNLVAFFL
jgi:hypothetical protein